jgi:dipeptidyl aminopeptidase/acylaminoacyl peptidase
MKLILLCIFAAAVLPVAGFTQTPSAQSAAPIIPVETLFRRPQYQGLTFSPDQKSLAATTFVDERQNLVIIDMEKRSANIITGFKDADVLSFNWASNNRLFYTTGDILGKETRGDGGLFAIDKDAKNPRTLVAPIRDTGTFVLRLTTVLGRIQGSSDEVLVSANDRSEDTQDIYRMNLMSGRKSLVNTSSPGQVVSWVIDSKNVPKAALSRDLEKKRWWFSYRADEASSWKVMAEWTEQLKDVVIPLRFEDDGSDMYVASNIGRNTLAFFKFNAATGKLGELIYGDDRYDMGSFGLASDGFGGTGSIITSAETFGEKGKILGVRYSGAKPTTVWFDDAAKNTQAMLDQALPNTVNRFDPNRIRSLVSARSDVDAGRYYIFDRDKKTLEDTGISEFPWIDPKQMAPMQYVEWPARDGIKIGGYLTLPKSYAKGSPVPLILHPHGGPWAKDNWGYNQEVQFMANRGFAVLQPNFRGSTGYGANHLRLSFRQWGGTMIDDMIDGVEWTIKAGYADKNRVAVYGASYGGYATLMALVKRPDMFKWGINYVGVTDMTVHQDTQPAQQGRRSAHELLKILNGDQKADKDLFEKHSPARQVGKIVVPVFHAYGGEDRNVDFANGRAIKSAFEKAERPFEWMFVGDEAHGYRTGKNRVEFYTRFDTFMKRHTPLPSP